MYGPPTLRCLLDLTVGIADSWAEILRDDLAWIRLHATGCPEADLHVLEGFQQWAEYARTQCIVCLHGQCGLEEIILEISKSTWAGLYFNLYASYLSDACFDNRAECTTGAAVHVL